MGPVLTDALITMAIVLVFLAVVIVVSAVFDLDGIIGPASIVAAGSATFVYLLLQRRRGRG